MAVFNGMNPFGSDTSGGGGDGGSGVTAYSQLTGLPSINGVPLIGDQTLESLGMTMPSNQAGQVKARFTGLQISGFTANTPARMFLREAATASVEAAPTTLWPQMAVDRGEDSYIPGFFAQGASEADDRIRENYVMGQVHRWRFAGNYAGKDSGNQGRLRCFLINPDSGFSLSSSLVMPAGLEGDNITFEFSSIADVNSLGAGRGYQLWFDSTFTDSGLVVTINSIVRISEAIDPGRSMT